MFSYDVLQMVTLISLN